LLVVIMQRHLQKAEALLLLLLVEMAASGDLLRRVLEQEVLCHHPNLEEMEAEMVEEEAASGS